uniref:uncharacterized protein LOC124068839 n=1 Tax=Scatophagus argus TaxID=75038 RepID=UPI001ED844FA|nr:uncharacterized protein LOC124068839 [Scatophagus argus]
MRMKIISVIYCLLYATWTEGKRINIKGFRMGEVSFQCSHSVAWKNHKYFCKNPCNNEDILVTVKSGEEARSERITLVDLGNGAFTVTFSQLQLADSGTYRCGVDRIGLDTFIDVQLTVEEAVETTTIIPGLSPTWTYQYISNSAQSTFGMDSTPTDLTAASNCTSGGRESFSTGTVLFTSIGAFAVFTILVLATCFRKWRKNSTPKPQVCSDCKDFFSADQREAVCENDNIGKDVQSIIKLSESFSCAHHPKQDLPTSAPLDDDSVPLHIYENICCSKVIADSRYSAAHIQDKHDLSSAVYIKPLPSIISERTDDSTLGKHRNEPKATRNATGNPTESCASAESAFHSSSCSNSKKERPPSLWFGLDLSRTV